MTSPWRDRAALKALLPLGALLAVIAVACPWYANFDVDTLTWFEQIRSVADHGSLGFENGPVADFPELRTRWFIHAGGRAWGIFPAALCYVLAPFMWLGGYKGVVRAIWAMLGLSALMVYGLVYRTTGRRHVAVGAAYALVLATSLGFWATMIAPFVPAATFGICAVYAAHRSFGHERLRSTLTYGLGAGALAGMALGSHLLYAIPWGFMGLACISLGPWKHRLARAAAYGVGSMPALGVMSWVNHQRFGQWTPVSYGPCDSNACGPHVNNQTAGAFLEGPKLLFPYVMAFAAALWLVRRSPRGVFTVVALGACAALLPDHELRDKWVLYARALWGFVASMSSFNTEYTRAPEGVGVFLHDWCVRSLLQCSPVLVLAFLGARSAAETARDSSVLVDPAVAQARAARRFLTASFAGVLVGAVMRADTGGAYVWGWPFLNVRYMTPLIPAATVLAAIAVAELPWRAAHAALVGVVGMAAVSWLSKHPETDVTRRWYTHIAPLWLSAATVALVVNARGAARGADVMAKVVPRVAAVAVALCLAYGVAVTVGIDAAAAADYRMKQTSRTVELARCTGGAKRFLLLGGYAMDEALALHDHRDITFINLGMGPPGGVNARGLVDRMMTPERPAFLIQDDERGPWWLQWEGFRFEHPAGDCARVYRVVRVAP
jgi:hypothetical protein